MEGQKELFNILKRFNKAYVTQDTILSHIYPPQHLEAY
jgi:hypothetical protein